MTIIFYQLFLSLYKTGIRCLTPWNRKAKLWLDGRKDLFSHIGKEMETGGTGGGGLRGPLIWMHCSSLGEFEQGRPLLEALRAEVGDCRIVLTFFSPSGYEVKKGYPGADHIFYLPIDGRRNARRFIDLVKPDLVLWVKYDYWYYYLSELKKREIPLLLVSGVFRPDQPFFKWYGKLHRHMLDCFTHLFVQTEGSLSLLAGIGLSARGSVSGDTRFDRVIAIATEGAPLPLIKAFCGERPVIVAGSTWEEDEEELDHYANTHPDIRFIIAPHEIGNDRLLEVERLFRHSIRYSSWEERMGVTGAAGNAGRGRGEGSRGAGNIGGGSGTVSRGLARTQPERTGVPPGWPEPNVLIIDNIGMLSRLYEYATITYVGGGFGDDGVHNVLEAAVYGKPVVFGPVIEKYIEAVELTECGGGLIIDSALEAEAVFNRLLNNSVEKEETGAASRNYVFSRRGATGKIIQYITMQKMLEK